MFLLNVFHNKRNDYERIPPHLLSSRNQDIVEHLRENYCDVLIMDITSDIGVPVINVYALLDEKLAISGQGCSLSFDYAVERALLECKQGVLVTPREVVEEQVENLANDARSANIMFYQHAFTYDPSFFSGNPLATAKSIGKYDRLQAYKDVGRQLSFVENRLSRMGYSIFYHERFADETCLHWVKTLIPGLEDFGLPGHVLIPSARGKATMAI